MVPSVHLPPTPRPGTLLDQLLTLNEATERLVACRHSSIHGGENAGARLSNHARACPQLVRSVLERYVWRYARQRRNCPLRAGRCREATVAGLA